ncbi:MAG: type IV pilus secretin PilQ [Proteobacteria bacterium]|nr:type IV pilus secretin PilQ [Pseudomonadota bacterium]MBU1386468.1 type IV pilus secretin PilQ [Pseudomonadota bacterium]MBU1544579.1 type IV pilus secretin PilQ [Pseudomonadota bacterium]MBU2481210.1 type IV pilus secretin PilQ [Pseudomonadota bacterium]
MIKQNILSCLVIFMCLITFTGCASTPKKTQEPDPYEKWRTLAQKSKGNTPGPRKHTFDIEKEEQTAARKTESPENENQKHETDPVQKALPTMPVSLKMHEVSVPVLLRTLARVANMNILINETVTGNANLNIENLPWDKAFTNLLNTYSLTYQWQDNVLRVITIEDLKKEISLMEARQTFEKTKKQHSIAMLSIQKEEEKLDPLVTEIIKIDYADLKPLRDNLEKYLLSGEKAATSLQENKADGSSSTSSPEIRGSILMDEYTNSLIIQATASDIKKIVPIIRQLDRPGEQILIEAHIVEANSDTAKELGVQWGGLGVNSGGRRNSWIGGPIGTFDSSLFVSTEDATAANPAGSAITHLPGIGNAVNFPSSENAGTAGWQGMTLGLMTQTVGNYILYAQLTALQKEGKLNILSKPSITTMDHKKAIIESGKEVPFQTIEDGETKIEFKKAVIKLEVTPHVINNEVIRLEILTHKDELDWTNTVSGNPTIITKNAETKVTLFDGQTTVIGGLNKEKLLEGQAGIPWLKDLPGLGVLFRSNSKSQDMEELLIFITPHILKQRPQNDSKDKDNR